MLFYRTVQISNFILSLLSIFKKEMICKSLISLIANFSNNNYMIYMASLKDEFHRFFIVYCIIHRLALLSESDFFLKHDFIVDHNIQSDKKKLIA